MYIIIVGILLIILVSAVVDFLMRASARKDARMRMAPRVELLLKEEAESIKYINGCQQTTTVVSTANNKGTTP